jgi:hypothetical protein
MSYHPRKAGHHIGSFIPFSTFLFVALLGLSLCQTHALPGDGHWDRRFNMPGTGSANFALRAFGNRIYAAGDSIGQGGLLGTNTVVNIFDGTNWSTVGDITSTGSGTCIIFDLALLGGNLYVGGLFSTAGGNPAVSLAKWDGTNWSNVGGASFALVYALATDGTNLYVGGSFTNAGGITNLAKWDETNWSAIGGGIGTYQNTVKPAVNAILWNQGQLYIGGNFTNAGTAPVTNLARWDGNTWSPIGGSVGGTNDIVQCIAFLGSDLYVAGQFTTAGGVSALNIAKWNGSTWSALGAGLKAPPNSFAGAPGSTPVDAIAFLGTDLYAAGTFTNAGGIAAGRVAKWDGFSWSTLGSINGNGDRAISNAGSIYISGTFNLASNTVANHIVRWDGSSWHPVSGQAAYGTHTFVQALSVGSDGLYMAGSFAAVGSTQASCVAHFDGTNWSPLGDGLTAPFSVTLTALGVKAINNQVYVSGRFSAAGGVFSTNIAVWDGVNWSGLGSGVDNPVGPIESVGSDIYIGGSFTNAYFFPGFGITVNNIARWDGSSWWSLGNGVNGTVNAICASGTSIYVGGSFTNADGNLANRIAMWDGNTWSSLGTGTSNGVSSTVLAILADGSDIYVGGTFTNAGTTVVHGIAKWNGSSWSALGQGAFGTGTAAIRALAKSGSYLYAAGTFTNIGGIITYNIGRWDGSQWQAMGSGIGVNLSAARGNALAASGNDVYVGGIFEDAGGGDAGYIAHWNDQIDYTPPSILRLSNPQMLSANGFKFRVTATERASYVVEYSSNLKTWNPLVTNSLSLFDVTDSVPGVNLRTYRMREIP